MLGREQGLATIRIDEDDRVALNSARDHPAVASTVPAMKWVRLGYGR